VIDAFLLFIAVSTLVTLTGWKRGLPLGILIGALQDPIRKLTPGTPALMVLSSLPVWLAVYTQVFSQAARVWRDLRMRYPYLWKAGGLFVLSLLPAIVLVLRHGAEAWRIALLGIFAYGAPLLAAAVGFVYVREIRQLERLLAFYCGFTSLMMVGTALEFAEVLPEFAALGTEALGTVWVRTTTGGPLSLISGFYRSPDIMAWHAAMLVMLGLTLAMHRRGARGAAWLLPVAWGALCLVIGGRRKAMMMPAVWAATVAVVYLQPRRAGRFISLAVMLAVVGGALYFAGGEIAVSEEYFAYASSASIDSGARILDGAWGSVWGTLYQTGFLGAGIGSASQGMRHLGTDVQQSWQESGPSKIAVELGLPGLLAALILGLATLRSCAVAVRRTPFSAPGSQLQLGLTAVVAANAASFVVSHQIYTDMLVVHLTAVALGIALAGPQWCHSTPRHPLRAAAAVRRPEPVPVLRSR
jgi:hypothetical protein